MSVEARMAHDLPPAESDPEFRARRVKSQERDRESRLLRRAALIGALISGAVAVALAIVAFG